MSNRIPFQIFVGIVAMALLHVPPAYGTTITNGERYLEARLLQDADKSGEAIPLFQEIAGEPGLLQPFAAEALVKAAKATKDDNLLLDALLTWTTTARTQSDRVEAKRAYGDALLDRDRPKDAITAYAYWEQHHSGRRDRTRARWALAEAHRAAGDVETATELLWQICNDDPTSLQARDALAFLPDPSPGEIRKRYDIGYVHLKHRSWAKAREWLEPLAQEPLPGKFEPQVLWAYADAISRTEHYTAGRAAMLQLALAYPHSGYARKAWQSRASYFSRERRYTDAVGAYDDVVDHAPKHDAAVQALWDGAKLLIKKDGIAAAERLETLIDRFPRHVLADDAARLRGFALYKAGRYAEAAAAFHDGWKNYPKRRTADDSSYWEGKSYQALGRVEDANGAFQRTLSRWPNSFYAYRAAQQLEVDSSFNGPEIVMASLGTLLTVPNALAGEEVPVTEDDGALPDHLADVVALFEWFQANDLPEAKRLVPELRTGAKSMAQQFRLARMAHVAGDYETCIWLADSVRKRFPAAQTGLLARLLHPEAWYDIIRPHAEQYDVDGYLSLAVMREESHFRDKIDSSAGARGVMQIMPTTGEWLGAKLPEAGVYSHDRLYDVPYNIQLGTYYLGYLMRKFDQNVVLAVASYNGGEGNVRRWVKRYGLDDIDLFIESIPYDETNEYVKKVLGSYGTYHRLAQATPGVSSE